MSLTVRVIAPTGRDAELITRVLQQNGMSAEISSPDALFQDAELTMIGPVLIAEEALSPSLLQKLSQMLREQPSWSDLPILVLTGNGRETVYSHRLQDERHAIGTPVLLERPIRTVTLVSSVKAALRARARQYEQKQSEVALIQNEKLAAVGRLAASISHEINNPLEAVTNLLYLARAVEGLPDDVKTYLEMANQELGRVSQIVSHTLRFHRQATSPRAITAEELLEPTLGLFGGRLSNSGIELSVRHSGSRLVTCYEGEIRQVLNNLVGNAIDSMRTGGKLTVKTHDATDVRSGTPGVRISVADNGSGMSREVVKKVFEAFYTTKGINGTGLGLWISRGIVEKHHGSLRFKTSDVPGNSGTVFSLFLPAKPFDERGK